MSYDLMTLFEFMGYNITNEILTYFSGFVVAVFVSYLFTKTFTTSKQMYQLQLSIDQLQPYIQQMNQQSSNSNDENYYANDYPDEYQSDSDLDSDIEPSPSRMLWKSHASNDSDDEDNGGSLSD